MHLQDQFFGFHSAGMGFFVRYLGTPFPKKKIIFIFAVRRPVPSKMVTPPKNYFSWLFWKILVFFFLEGGIIK